MSLLSWTSELEHFKTDSQRVTVGFNFENGTEVILKMAQKCVDFYRGAYNFTIWKFVTSIVVTSQVHEKPYASKISSGIVTFMKDWNSWHIRTDIRGILVLMSVIVGRRLWVMEGEWACIWKDTQKFGLGLKPTTILRGQHLGVDPGAWKWVFYEANGSFLRFFWAFGLCIRSHKVHFKMVICMEVTHLTLNYFSTLLVACACGTPNHIFPIAFSIMELENKVPRSDAWCDGLTWNAMPLLFLIDRKNLWKWCPLCY